MRFLRVVFLVLPLLAIAAEPTIDLEKPGVTLHDKKAIGRGAKTFATLCMSCHTMIYLRYDKFAEQNGVLYDKMPTKVKWPEGAVPPDLSLEASARGTAWIYTYLHSFYVDATRPTGYNNLLIPNAMMPGILSPMQGQQIRVPEANLPEVWQHHYQWYDLVSLQSKGSMDPEQFDRLVADIVSFLAYAAEPYHEQQVQLGWKVIAFLLIFFVMVYSLKKMYWRSIK